MGRSAPTRSQCLREIRARLKGSSSFAFPQLARACYEQRINHHWTPEDLAHAARMEQAGRGIRHDHRDRARRIRCPGNSETFGSAAANARCENVRRGSFIAVPRSRSFAYSITSSARASSDGGTSQATRRNARHPGSATLRIESLARTYERPALWKPFAAFPADSKVA